MRLFHKGKDGGIYSHVWGYWLVEIKKLFSVVLLRFEDGSREAYHEHAFDCVNWVFSGRLEEDRIRARRDSTGEYYVPAGHRTFRPSWRPFIIRRKDFHQVRSAGRSWVLSFRGPWRNTWREQLPGGEVVSLTHGRREV